MIRVILPHHLHTLARTGKEVQLEVNDPVCTGNILNTLESTYPVLRGTVRDQVSGQRRAFVRFFACGQDISLDPEDVILPEAIIKGKEPFRIVGAMAGG